MKISPLVVLLAGMLLGSLIWGTCNAGRATEAQIKLEAALAQHGAALDRWQDERTGLSRRLSALQEDSASLARAYAGARFSAAQARLRGDSLLRLVPDSLGIGIRLAFDSLAGVITSCEAVSANCELRAQNAEARAHGDSIQVWSLTLLTDSLEAAWHTELKRNQPNIFRDAWKARAVTIPLLGITALLLLQR